MFVYRVQSRQDGFGPYTTRWVKGMIHIPLLGPDPVERELYATFMPKVDWQEEDHETGLRAAPDWKSELWVAAINELKEKLKAGQIQSCGFGCLSVDHLRAWITPSEMRKLEAHGFHCVIVEAHEILVDINDGVGASQCFFTKVGKPTEYLREFQLYQ